MDIEFAVSGLQRGGAGMAVRIGGDRAEAAGTGADAGAGGHLPVVRPEREQRVL